jgi:formate hydrogenlyase subunit 6/NADH:ubiquinone oxidoreductase subunit I
MVYVITGACCKDGVCESACPEEAISAGTVTVDGTEYDQYFIDPAKCSECGSCESVCPELAIFSTDDLPVEAKPYKAINAAFYKQ